MSIHTATHPDYDRHQSDWQIVRKMLTGDGAASELIKRFFEHEDHHDQRRKDADFTPRTRFLLSRLAGMLHQRYEDVQRDVGSATAVEERLPSAGPAGEDYAVLMLQLTTTLLAYNTAVVVLHPSRGLYIRPPLAMPHWTGREAVIKSTRTQAESVMEDGTEQETWVRYKPEGYEVYVEPDDDSGSEEAVLVDQGAWVSDAGEEAPFFVDDEGRPTAPVLRVEMPWEARVGLLVAKKHRAIFRMGSRRDMAASAAMNTIIQLGVGDSQDLSDQITQQLRKGFKTVPYDSDYGPHKGLEMPTAGVKVGASVLEEKTKDLNRVAYNELERGARTSGSATEAQIRHQGGAAAALSVVAQTMSDAEARILRLMAQAADFPRYAGPRPQDPGVSVQWPTDYSDVLGVGDTDLVGQIFGSMKLPADVDSATDAVMERLQDEGHDPDRGAVRDRVEQRLGNDDRQQSAQGFL